MKLNGYFLFIYSYPIPLQKKIFQGDLEINLSRKTGA